MATVCFCGGATCLQCAPTTVRSNVLHQKRKPAFTTKQKASFSVRCPKRKSLVVRPLEPSVDENWRRATATVASASTNSQDNVQLTAAEVESAAKPKLSYFQQLAAGAAAGAVVSAIIFPINTIKTRVMAGTRLGSIRLSSCLWRGVGFDTFGQAATTAVFFGTYGLVRDKFGFTETQSRSLTNLQKFWGEAVPSVSASLVSSLLVVPNEAIRQNVQAHTYASPLGAFRGILKERGFGGLYRGYRYALLRDVPFDSVQFTLYQIVRSSYLTAVQREQLTPTETAVIGGSAGALTGFFTTPIDVIKTQRVLYSGAAHGGKQLNMMGTVSKMVAKDGLSGLFKGAGPRAVEIALGGVIFFSVLEQVQQIFLSKVARPHPHHAGG